MACGNYCSVCDHLAWSLSTAFADGQLTLTIANHSYTDGEKVCIITGQPIPAEATVDAPVVITFASGDTDFPLVTREGTPVTAAALRYRTRYATRVDTTPDGAVFRLLGHLCGEDGNKLPYINEET